MVYAVKIHNLWDQHGPDVVKWLRGAGAKRVMVDLKLDDIPRTVKRRAHAIAQAGADILTVKASAEVDAMRAAVEGAKEGGGEREVQIVAVTVLTSLTEEMAHLLHGQPAKAAALYLARLAALAEVHAIVCSPHEVGALTKRWELRDLEFWTPGIRSAGKDAGDQKRFDTPGAAIKAGATRLVIGSQITEAPNPVAALAELETEIAQAVAAMEGGKS
jgi:orotidine-5'-phosphate decarboxylase